MMCREEVDGAFLMTPWIVFLRDEIGLENWFVTPGGGGMGAFVVDF